MNKRLVAFLLLFCVLFSLSSCQGVEVKTQTQETETSEKITTPIKTENKNLSVADPLTWDKLNAFPIANSEMTQEELRKLCVDFFRLELSFQWTPSSDVSYNITTHNNQEVSFTAGKLYGGIPYQGATNGGSPYLWMQYYDEKTGVLDVDTLNGKNVINLLANHCSHGSFWAWSRVINSINTRGTRTFTAANGCIPIGPYTYDPSIQEWSTENKKGSTDEVCELNGEQVMYQSYAQVLPGDGLVSTGPSSGHVQMASEKAHVEKNADGTIDGQKSYIIILEQASVQKDYQHPDGSVATVQGGIDSKVSFAAFFKGSYIPFTFKEFMGTDPVEKAVTTLNLPSGAATVEQLAGAVITSNYPISDVTVRVTDGEGNEVYRYQGKSIPESKLGNAVIAKTLPIERYVIKTALKRFVGKADHTVSVDCRVGSGDLTTVYAGTMVSE